MKDIRIPQVKKIICGILSKSDIGESEALILGDTLIIVTDNSLLYTVQLSDLPILPPIAFNCKETIELENEDEYIYNDFIYNKLINLFKIYSSLDSNSLLTYDNDLKLDEKFQDLLSLKSADGMRFYKLIGNNLNEFYHIPIYCGFPNISKSDKIGVSIYNFSDTHLLIVYNIFRKKINREYKLMFRTLKLYRG